jgi:DNA modification methylase
MGYSLSEIRKLRGESIGAEVSLSKQESNEFINEVIRKTKTQSRLSERNLAIFSRYIKDMNTAVSEVERVLKPGGLAYYVVGNSSLKGTFVRNSVVVQAVAESNGLTLVEKRTRPLPPNRRYLPPPTAGKQDGSLSTRMREEVVLAFRAKK